MLAPREKTKALRRLATKRKRTRMKGYRTLGDYKGGRYDCNYVSPWSKSAHNVNAKVMIVGHDWSSEEWMRGPVDKQSAERGYSDRFPTNRNLFDLLKRHFDLCFSDVYATNAFPFIKKGNSQGSISHRDLQWAVCKFLLPQIEIIQPVIVICLGKATFNAVRGACGEAKISKLDDAIKKHFSRNPMIFAVAHTGSLTTNLRGRRQIDRDWAALRRRFDKLRAKR